MTRQEQIEKAATAKSRGETPYFFDAFVEGAEWADAHPCWISVADELPPRWEKYPHLSEDVLCSDGVNVMLNSYDYSEAEWTYGVGMSPITHWMPMPALPMEIRGNQGKISPNHIIGTEEHIKVALDVLDKKGGEQCN